MIIIVILMSSCHLFVESDHCLEAVQEDREYIHSSCDGRHVAKGQ